MNNVLVIGNGAREHAITRSLQQSPKVGCVYCPSPNAGMLLDGVIDVAILQSDLLELKGFVQRNDISLTVVGPEDPLVGGIVDIFEEDGLLIFGPSAEASRLEGSKIFMKSICERAGIKTADSRSFDAVVNSEGEEGVLVEAILGFCEKIGFPAVLKADGLSAGKGVIICQNQDEAVSAVKLLCRDFKGSSERILVEEYLSGREVSFFALSDGKVAKMFHHACDFKKVSEGDCGPNTGGMGSFAPSFIDLDQERLIMDRVVNPAIFTLSSEGVPYKGVLFAGLMVSDNGDVYLLEFNCRFGDPETQSMLPLLETDLFDLMCACAKGNLGEVGIKFSPNETAVSVTLASNGYPAKFEKGVEISSGSDSAAGLMTESGDAGFRIFHAGTKLDGKSIKTSGGRVLTVTGVASDKKSARHMAYKGAEMASHDGLFYRRDIAN